MSQQPVPDSHAIVFLLDAQGVATASLADFLAWLTPQELARYRRFMRPLRQRQFLLGRALLRSVLGQALGWPAASVMLAERAGQAPQLLPAGEGPCFSLSHSGHWIACALSATPVGLDIEIKDARRDLLALARQAFGEAAQAHLASLPLTQRSEAFYLQWSQYEARYKLGAGLAEAASCVALAHEELSIVVCSAAPFLQPPQLQIITQMPA